MAVTDQIKILNIKIKQNEAQYDLDRKAAKISVLSSNNLDKYEYLTGEDFGLKPSTIEQAKFEYYPLGNTFTKGLKEEDKKEGLFRRLENIKDKNEELLNAFSATNKVSKASKNESNYNYDSNYTFHEFYKDSQKFTRMSLGSKYDEMIDFYTLFNTFISTQNRKNRKNRILSYVKLLYNNYLDAYKKNYDNKELADEDKIKYDYKRFEIIDNRD